MIVKSIVNQFEPRAYFPSL